MSCTPLYPMVLLIIIPFWNGYFIGNINPTFSGPNPNDDAEMSSFSSHKPATAGLFPWNWMNLCDEVVAAPQTLHGWRLRSAWHLNWAEHRPSGTLTIHQKWHLFLGWKLIFHPSESGRVYVNFRGYCKPWLLPWLLLPNLGFCASAHVPFNSISLDEIWMYWDIILGYGLTYIHLQNEIQTWEYSGMYWLGEVVSWGCNGNVVGKKKSGSVVSNLQPTWYEFGCLKMTPNDPQILAS